ncbi:MAG TPA: hypothetical protein VIK35_02285 [Verrucomicrobiae bacterium]
MATSETDELRNGREDRRGAAIREKDNGRAKNGKFNSGSDFNPSDRGRNRNVTRRSFDFSMCDKDDGAIVIVFGNSPTVQPRMKRRANFRRRHEKPHGQRQNRRRCKYSFARAAFYWIYQLQTVCVIADTVPGASRK